MFKLLNLLLVFTLGFSDCDVPNDPKDTTVRITFTPNKTELNIGEELQIDISMSIGMDASEIRFISLNQIATNNNLLGSSALNKLTNVSDDLIQIFDDAISLSANSDHEFLDMEIARFTWKAIKSGNVELNNHCVINTGIPPVIVENPIITISVR